MSKPLPRLYPLKLETIGDHIKTKRLDLKLRQKDLVKPLKACEATVKNWEKGYRQPSAESSLLITQFLGYCPLIHAPVDHFGHQLRNYRIYTVGQTLLELSSNIGIDIDTLNDIEQNNIIRHAHVFNAVKRFLDRIDWVIPDNSPPAFRLKRTKCRKSPKFHPVERTPRTLGEHIALKRRELGLTQLEAMKRIGVKSVSAYRSWEKHGIKPYVRFYPKIMEFLGYCPIEYPRIEGQQLKLMRIHLGLSYRNVDRILGLTKGCAYRIESTGKKNEAMVNKMNAFYEKSWINYMQ